MFLLSPAHNPTQSLTHTHADIKNSSRCWLKAWTVLALPAQSAGGEGGGIDTVVSAGAGRVREACHHGFAVGDVVMGRYKAGILKERTIERSK